MTVVEPSAFEVLAGTLMANIVLTVAVRTRNRRFLSCFGISPNVCSCLWMLVRPLLPDGATPLHLLWALFFLKVYGTEEHNASVAGCDEKTF